MKKTKCMGTSKNKRAMSGGSGGKGRVSRYTKKFKKCYENFSKIVESDPNDIKNDDTKIRKMEEWGRLRGIYTYLKSKNIKSKNIEGNDGTFLEKMKVNLGDNFNKYTNAMSCLENDSAILLKHGCVLEKDYVNSKKDSDIPTVETKKANVISENIKVDEVEQAQEQTENTREETQRAEEEAETARQDMLQAKADAEKARQERLKAEDDNQPEAVQSDDVGDAERANEERLKAEAMKADDEAVDEAPAPDAEVSNDTVVQSDVSHDPAKVTPVGDAEAPAQADNTVGQPGIAVDEAPASDIDADAYKQRDDQGGGRSKRRRKYSRRRGKSMKSKKGRKTRRR